MSGMPDFVTGTTFHARVMTVNGSGKPTTVGNSPAVVFYQDGNTTAFSAGLTLSTDFASVTGLSSIQVLATTSATGVAAGSTYSLHFSAGTVSGVSVIGYPIFSWTLEKQSALRPTTAGRTLAVAATGGAAIDWGNVGNPGTTVDLAATTLFLVDTATDVTNDVGAIVTAVNTVVPARVTAQGIDVGAIVTAFNTIAPANVTAFSTNIGAVVTASSINIGAIVTAFNTIAAARVTVISASGLAAMFLTDSGTTYALSVAGSPVKEIADNAGGTSLTVTAISSGVWDRDATSNQVQGSFGQAIGDPGADATTLYAAAVTNAAGADIAADIIAVKADTTAILLDTVVIGAAGSGLTAIDLPDQTMNITGNLSGSVGSVTAQVNANVTAASINIGAIVTAFNTIAPANVTAISTVVPANVTAASASGIAQFFLVNSGTTYAAATAGSVVKETADNAGGSALTVTAISSGVWDRDATSNQVQGSFGQAIGDPGADATTLYQAAVTDAAGTDIAADIIAMKADVTSIKAKVTALTFTVAAQVDANIQSVNDTTVTGDGGAGTEWGP